MTSFRKKHLTVLQHFLTESIQCRWRHQKERFASSVTFCRKEQRSSPVTSSNSRRCAWHMRKRMPVFQQFMKDSRRCLWRHQGETSGSIRTDVQNCKISAGFAKFVQSYAVKFVWLRNKSARLNCKLRMTHYPAPVPIWLTIYMWLRSIRNSVCYLLQKYS